MFCPVCNGLQPLAANCDNCREPLNDLGRMADLTGPYAPYEPLDLLEQLEDTAICKHIAFCLNCQQSINIAIKEWF